MSNDAGSRVILVFVTNNRNDPVAMRTELPAAILRRETTADRCKATGGKY
jgi:hypothetical protein